jgi:hypothetical protein
MQTLLRAAIDEHRLATSLKSHAVSAWRIGIIVNSAPAR